MQKAATANRCGFLKKQKSGLTLGELLAATSGVQADLFTFDFTGVTGDKTSLAQHGLERSIVVNQGAGDAVARCAGLTGFATAVPVLGVTEATLIYILGSLGAALAIDGFGLLGATAIPVTTTRILGIVLAVVGFLLARR